MFSFHRINNSELNTFRELMQLFGKVFEDDQSYQSHLSTDTYIAEFLNDPSHIVLVATDEQGTVVGGLVAYVLKKFEQQRSEVYVYDLAVSETHQRKGVGTGLFEKLKEVAKEINAYAIFVQADNADDGAIAFYRSLTNDEIIAHHFDIKV